MDQPYGSHCQLQSAGFLHHLMGHIGVKGPQYTAKGIDFDDSSLILCSICAITNIKQTPFPHYSTHHAIKLLQHVLCDICSPLSSCYGSYKYFILFICCYSHYISVCFMKSHDEALQCFTKFCSAAETFPGKKTT